MAALWLPSDDRHTLALREPNLLVPGRKPLGIVRRRLFAGQKDENSTSTLFELQPTFLMLNSHTELGVANGAPPKLISYETDGEFFHAQLAIGEGSGLNSYGVADHTWTFVFKYNGNGTLFANSVETSGNRTVRILVSSTTNVQFLTGNNGTWSDFNLTLPEALQVGRVYILTARQRTAISQVQNVNKSIILNDYAPVSQNLGFTTDSFVFPNPAGSWLIVAPENTNQLKVSLMAKWPVCLSDNTVRQMHRNIFAALVESANQTPYLISVPTGGAITGTGSVASQSSAIAGTAEREITGTSALESQSSTIAGTGAIGGAITGTAVLAAQSSTIVGTGTRVITSAAELVSQASVIAGAAERVITGISGIEAQSSTIAGTGTVAAAGTVIGTGALDSQSSTISGTGILARTGTGAIAAGVASIDATGIITRVGTGALASQASSISGTGTASTPLTITGTGSLVCGVSSISGSQQTPVWTTIARVETVWTEI